jgi:hypothetical protein
MYVFVTIHQQNEVPSLAELIELRFTENWVCLLRGTNLIFKYILG